MKMHIGSWSRGLTAAAAGLALSVVPPPGLAQARAHPGTLGVTIQADRYLAGGREFADLDSLQAWAIAQRPRAVALDLCEPASPRRLLAAAYRFRDVRIDMHLRGAEHSACTAVADVGVVRVAVGIRPAPPPDEDQAVDRYWRSLMP